MKPTVFANLSDDELLLEVKRLAAAERTATASLLCSLIEVDARRLYLGQGCSSLFTYCTQVLRLEEGAAYNRIEAARAARRFPAILEALAEGAMTLTSVRLLAPHLTDENHDSVLASARHRSKREVEALVAALNPRPDVQSVVRKLPQTVRKRVAPTSDVSLGAGLQPIPETRTATLPLTDVERSHGGTAKAPDHQSTTRLPSAPPAGPQPAIAALAPERYKVQITISRDMYDKLRRVQDLLRHAVPSGDPAEIFDRALSMLLENLERRRGAATPCPRAPRHTSERSRHVPAAVRRAVWQRDEGRCAFIGAEGRCTERGFLEFHHVQPYASGGSATVGNIQLRCRAHNQHEAAVFFGEDHVVREVRAPWIVDDVDGAHVAPPRW